MKIMLIAISLLYGISTNGQYISYGANSGGVSLGLGMVTYKGTDVSIHYDFPIFSATKPHYTSLNLGQMIALAETYYVTPKIGIAAVNTKYEYKGSLREEKTHKPVFELELSKQRDNARVSLITKYCNGIYFGFSSRVFFNRNRTGCTY